MPFFNPTDRLGYPVDPPLLARLRPGWRASPCRPCRARRAARASRRGSCSAPILSGDQYIHCEATRERLFRELGGAAVEMEGGALGQVAEAFGIPYLDIRALSDLAGKSPASTSPPSSHEVAGSSAMILRRLLPVL